MKDQGSRASGARDDLIWTRGGLAAVLFLIPWVLFGHTLRFEFVYDDSGYVADNEWVKRGLSLEGIRWAFTTNEMANWHPLTWLSLMADASLWGIEPAGFRATNLLIHAATCVLLFLSLERLTSSISCSFWVAALSAAHPLNVESVVWISERKGILSSFFFMATLFAYSRYLAKPHRTAWYALTLTGFVLGLLAKQMLVTVPLVLLLIDYWEGRLSGERNGKRILIEKLPFIVITAVFAIVAYEAQRRGGALELAAGHSWEARLLQVPVTIATYLWRTIWPANLGVAYLPSEQTTSWPMALLATSLLITATIAAVWSRSRAILVGWLWFLIVLAPLSGLVTVGRHFTADRYAYLPIIGLFIAIVWMFAGLASQVKLRRPLFAIGAIILVALSVVSRQQSLTWRDGEALYTQALAVNPQNYLAHTNLGAVLSKKGALDQANVHFKEALRIEKNDEVACLGLGINLLAAKDRTAVSYLERAIAIRPDFDKAWYHLGRGFAQFGDRKGAIRAYRKTLELTPGHLQTVIALSQVLADSRKLADAVELLETESARVSHAEIFRRLGGLYVMQGRLPEALAACRRAVQLSPRSPDAHYTLGRVLEDCGDRSGAIDAYKQALRFKPDHSLAASHYSKLITVVRTQN